MSRYPRGLRSTVRSGERSMIVTVASAALVAILASTTAVASIVAPSPGGAVPARHWAGDLTADREAETTVARAGGPGALSRLATTLPSTSTTDGEWSLVSGSTLSSGPARVTGSAIFDAGRHRMVAFGGGDGAGYLHDTWALQTGNSTWVSLTTQGTTPAGRRLHSAIYDTANDRMIVFGGYDGTFFNDVWALSFQTDPPSWSEIVATGTPPAGRAGHAAVYDPDGQRMIVLAGYDGASAPALRRRDVWTLSLDGSPTWTEITPAIDGPSARSSLEAVYDAARERVVLFGGTDPEFLDDAWALSLGATPEWSAIDVGTTRPPAREEHSAIYDAANHRMVVLGGYDADYYYGDTWSLSLTDPAGWTELTPSGVGPGARWGHTAVYDPDAAQMIVFSGRDACSLRDDTHELALTGPPAWTNPAATAGSGPVRHTFASAYDSNRNRALLFGGSSVATILGDVHSLQLDEHPQWSPLAVTGTPPAARRLAEAIYDPQGDRLVLFGGWNGTILGDLHQLSFASGTPTWSTIAASVPTPPARAGHGAIYDPVGRRMIVFGGYDGVSTNYRINDLWSLDLATDTWQELSPAGTPPSPRSSFSAVYDSKRHRMLVLFGTTPSFLNEVWALSLDGDGEWTQLTPSGTAPAPREEQSAMYDAVRDRVVIVGGYINSSFTTLDDVWALSLDGDPTWAALSPSGPHPPRRWGHAAVYDPLLDRMVMHGGLGPGLDQTWALTWGQPATAAPTLIQVQADASAARLTWNVSGGSFFNTTIYRAVEGGGWVATGNAPVNAAGNAVFEDHAVAAGMRYGYRAAVQTGGTELTSPTTWVTIPGALAVAGPRATLAILGVRQMGSALSVRYSLPSAAPARIVLLDVGGRTLASGDVGSAGSGNHEVALEGRGGLAPGVYWVSLRQNDAAVNFKALVVR